MVWRIPYFHDLKQFRKGVGPRREGLHFIQTLKGGGVIFVMSHWQACLINVIKTWIWVYKIWAWGGVGGWIFLCSQWALNFFRTFKGGFALFCLSCWAKFSRTKAPPPPIPQVLNDHSLTQWLICLCQITSNHLVPIRTPLYILYSPKKE